MTILDRLCQVLGPHSRPVRALDLYVQDGNVRFSVEFVPATEDAKPFIEAWRHKELEAFQLKGGVYRQYRLVEVLSTERVAQEK